ncbi:MAG TPA: hypothetical protein VMZ06_02200 [Candidatus Bathyarchaeia archaeon]|nr:hypothetical protein [Candidatus Bathyarchaeia archaeon]
MKHVPFGIAVMAILCAASSAFAAERLANVRVIEDVYPRAFYFRQTESMAAQARMMYEEWERHFSLLDGIMGKCLDEEVPGRIDLTLDVEGGEPVYLSGFRVYNAPDLVVREFEHGIVLANPSNHEHAFDLGGMFRGQIFRRIQAHPEQSPTTNNSKRVGTTVEIGPRDALFLIKE